MHPVLNDTSLCAIVRDEKMNPAGGIASFIESHIHFVEEAVIVDTGSVDGTRELLEKTSLCYPNLRVYDRNFDGYASSRNFALDQVQTKRALVLDADELLTREDFEKLSVILKEKRSLCYGFNFVHVYTDIAKSCLGSYCNPRLFDISPFIRYRRELWEILYFGDIPSFHSHDIIFPTGISIKHFLAYQEACLIKDQEWYTCFQYKKEGIFFKKPLPSPSKLPSFAQWKQFNPQRNEYS